MELKTYSVLIAWSDSYRDDGEYGATVRAPTPDEAEAMTRAKMRATGDGSWPFGSVLDCSEGAAWAAADLEKALRYVSGKLGSLHDADSDDQEMHIIADIEEAVSKALKCCEPDGHEWGALHFDGSEEPDWSRFAYLEIDGCVTDDDGLDDPSVIGGKPDDEAEFWTIYGREKETGMAQAVQDCVSRAEADHVLRLMMESSGLPGYRVGEEMPDAIKNVPFPHDRDYCDGEHSAALLEDPHACWRYAVVNKGTTLGFEEWQAQQREEAA